MSSIHLVLCTDRGGRIGADGKLLYHIPLDLQRFTSLTTHASDPTKTNVVMMGHATWMSLPASRRPLPGRVNVVLTHTPEHVPAVRQAGAYPFLDVASACGFMASVSATVERVYLIGGATLYAHPALRALVQTVHWTLVDEDRGLDNATTFDVKHHFSAFDTVESWATDAPGVYVPTDEKATFPVRMQTLVRRDSVPVVAPLATLDVQDSRFPSAETQYLALLARLMEAPLRPTRNATVRSAFGTRLVVPLGDGTVPALTTKKFAWKTCLRELLWFVRGDTDNAKLQAANVHIWDANASRAFLDSRGLTERAENDLGPVYGFQWRHSGAAYVDCHTDYAGQGVDQLEANRKQLLADPHDRRILFTAWNPGDLDAMALPPCHVLGQWYVKGGNHEHSEHNEHNEHNEKELWLQVYQRSGDAFLGVPFNLFSYSTLVHMMAHLTKLRPGGLVYILGDAHVYDTHEEAVRTQLARTPSAPPTLRVVGNPTTWEAFTTESFALEGYQSAGPIRAAVVA
jgi:dihydrofolate reductase/thymidylate synthase